MAKPKLNNPEEITRLVSERKKAEQKIAAAEEEKKSEPAYFLDSEGFLCRTKQTKDGRITVRLRRWYIRRPVIIIF